MLRKRIIFTLIYSDGFFCLSRNFRLQKIGNLNWLQENYNFSKISQYIDELIILNASREKKNQNHFLNVVKKLTKSCFMPVAVGGGTNDIEYVNKLMMSGADKIVLNTSIFESSSLVNSIAKKIGNQSIVASLDLKLNENKKYDIFIKNGSKKVFMNIKKIVNKISRGPFGEILINSIDRDGTGQGYDLNILKYLSSNIKTPVILSGGAGNFKHLLVGLRKKKLML